MFSNCGDACTAPICVGTVGDNTCCCHGDLCNVDTRSNDQQSFVHNISLPGLFNIFKVNLIVLSEWTVRTN